MVLIPFWQQIQQRLQHQLYKQHYNGGESEESEGIPPDFKVRLFKNVIYLTNRREKKEIFIYLCILSFNSSDRNCLYILFFSIFFSKTYPASLVVFQAKNGQMSARIVSKRKFFYLIRWKHYIIYKNLKKTTFQKNK